MTLHQRNRRTVADNALRRPGRERRCRGDGRKQAVERKQQLHLHDRLFVSVAARHEHAHNPRCRQLENRICAEHVRRTERIDEAPFHNPAPLLFSSPRQMIQGCVPQDNITAGIADRTHNVRINTLWTQILVSNERVARQEPATLGGRQSPQLTAVRKCRARSRNCDLERAA